MTLIEQRRSDGTLQGRCDAKCYRAKGKKCKCICGGVNHGTGYCKALVEQTGTVYRKLIKENPDFYIEAPIVFNPQGFLF